MRGCFKGWRRKLGCVTLVLACVFMGAWMRSFNHTDEIHFFWGKRIHSLSVQHNGIVLARLEMEEVLWQQLDWNYANSSSRTYDPYHHVSTLVQQRHWFGFHYEERSLNDYLATWTFVIIPYRAIDLPLALLSAWLLLSKQALGYRPDEPSKDQP